MKYFLMDLKTKYNYWVFGACGNHYVPVSERLDYIKCLIYNKLRKIFLCPIGRHYIKWNSGDPSCIICWKRHNEIYK